MNLFEKQSRLNQLFTQSPVNAAYLAGSLSTRTSFGHLTDVDIAILLMDQIRFVLVSLLSGLISGGHDRRGLFRFPFELE